MQSDQSRARVFGALHDIAVAVGGVLEPVELARLVVESARDLMHAGAAGLYVFDEAAQLLRSLFSSDVRETEPEPPIPIGEGAAGQALLLGKPMLVDDYGNWPQAGAWAAAASVRSAIAVPLLIAERRTGALSVRTYAPRQWTEEDAQILTLLAAQIAPVLEAAQLYEATRVARLQAEAASRLRDEVLAGVSHDLAGSLGNIRLYAELIQAETESPALQPAEVALQLADWSERIVIATTTMHGIMQELIEVARMQMGRAVRLDKQQTDLVALVRQLARDRQAAGRQVEVITSVEELNGLWDPGRLVRVIGNLLENAIVYSADNTSVDMIIEPIQDERGRAVAMLRVKDRGRGIRPEDLPRVFERFYRGASDGAAVPGNGVGLANVRQIVEQHDGRIEIESQLGAGTLVSVYLPRESTE